MLFWKRRQPCSYINHWLSVSCLNWLLIKVTLKKWELSNLRLNEEMKVAFFTERLSFFFWGSTPWWPWVRKRRNVSGWWVVWSPDCDVSARVSYYNTVHNELYDILTMKWEVFLCLRSLNTSVILSGQIKLNESNFCWRIREHWVSVWEDLIHIFISPPPSPPGE